MKFSLSLALSLCSVAQAGKFTEVGDLAQTGSPAEASDLVQAENLAQTSDFVQPDGPTLAGDLTEADSLVQSDTPAPTGGLFQPDSPFQAGSLFQTDSPAQDSKPAEDAPPVQVTDVLDNHGYEVQDWGDGLLIFSPEYEEGCEFVDAIYFYPRCKAVLVSIAKNDKEPEHEKKLGLTEVFDALAKRKGMEPNEMRVVVFEIEKDDPNTDEVIAEIRRGRNVDTWGEVRISPGEKEWDTILATEYYVKLLEMTTRPVQKILIRTSDHVDWWGKVVHTNRIFFSFGPLESKTPVPGTATEVSATEVYPKVYEEEQEAEFLALIAEEDKSKDKLQAV